MQFLLGKFGNALRSCGQVRGVWFQKRQVAPPPMMCRALLSKLPGTVLPVRGAWGEHPAEWGLA